VQEAPHGRVNEVQYSKESERKARVSQYQRIWADLKGREYRGERTLTVRSLVGQNDWSIRNPADKVPSQPNWRVEYLSHTEAG
jgi:hypothetical protein